MGAARQPAAAAEARLGQGAAGRRARRGGAPPLSRRTGWVGRPLTPGERALAHGVFGEALDLDAVRLHAHPFGGFAVTLGRRVLFPGALPADFAGEPLARQAWLVHELTHVWQFRTAPLRTLASWARVAVTGGYGPGLPGYRYPWPPPPWAALNLEQQASLVEAAFLARASQAPDTRRSANPACYAGLTPFDRLG